MQKPPSLQKHCDETHALRSGCFSVGEKGGREPSEGPLWTHPYHHH